MKTENVHVLKTFCNFLCDFFFLLQFHHKKRKFSDVVVIRGRDKAITFHFLCTIYCFGFYREGGGWQTCFSYESNSDLLFSAHHLAHQVQAQGLELLKKSLLRNPDQQIGLHRLLKKENHLLQSRKESRHPRNLPEDHHHPQGDGLPHRFVDHLYPRPHLLHLCMYQSLRKRRKQIKF